MRKELAEVVQFLGLDGGEGDEHTGGGSTLGAGWWDVFREGGVGGSWDVFPHRTGPCKACATPKQGPRVCSKGGGGLGVVCCGQEH